MLKDIIKGFTPWIVFFILLGPTQKQIDIAIIAAFIAFFVFEIQSLKKGYVLSIGTLVFFIFAFLSIVIFKNQWVVDHVWIFSNGVLMVIAWISLMLKKPFTIQYAKKHVAKEKWSHPIFIKINQYLTLFWGILFTFCLLINILKIYYPLSDRWIYEILTDGASILGICLTIWFPDWYRNKYKRTHNEK